MQAAVLYEPDTPPVIEETSEREPPAREVVVRSVIDSRVAA
jgi:D-arabinose 1-dehydrogenase-like Zn-dependent alcohol dehydrogenase